MTFQRLPIKRLGDVFLGKMIQPEPRDKTDVPAPYLRAAHVQPNGTIVQADAKTMWFGAEELAQHGLRRGDVVIVEGGAGYGRSAVIREDRPGWGLQNSIIRVRPRADVAVGRFLDYALQSALVAGEIEIACYMATIPHFTADKVAAFPVPAPPAGYQRAIADYLDRETAKIDILIEEQQRLIDLLHERRQAVITGQVSGHPPTRLRRLVVPERPMSYGILQCGEHVEDGTPYLGPSDMPGEGDPPPLEGLRRTTHEIAAAYARSTLMEGDVVVSIGPAYGKVAVVSADLSGANLTQDTVRVACDDTLVDTRYLVWVLCSRETADYWDLEIAGATFRRLNLGTLARTPIPLPSLVLQRRIAAYLDEQTAKIDTLIAETERFIELSWERRAALITAAVTGQIDVREDVA